MLVSISDWKGIPDMTASQTTPDVPKRRVGSDRVLSLLTELAAFPDGASLDTLANHTGDAKPTVHRGLASLVRAGLVDKESRGRYVLGDEFLRLAFAHHEQRPESVRVRPILEQLTARFGETTHYAVLDGASIVYRAKVDPSGGAVKLTSTVGGRNPATTTGVGKVLLSQKLQTADAVVAWVAKHGLSRATGKSVTGADELHVALKEVRSNGYAVDDQENEPGINCIAFPLNLATPGVASGAVSISALAYRTPLAELVAAAEEIRALIDHPQTFDDSPNRSKKVTAP